MSRPGLQAQDSSLTAGLILHPVVNKTVSLSPDGGIVLLTSELPINRGLHEEDRPTENTPYPLSEPLTDHSVG